AHAKRFLTLPIPLYFYRSYNTSITRRAVNSAEKVYYWISEFNAFLGVLSELKKRNELLRANPYYCYEAARKHFHGATSTRVTLGNN
ncbi:MAG: hypothetical protein IJG32_04295, partial [Selenomonadaceae bacterium]|nr:hypothetical protein [Selenomonadaceae bacterium]